MPARARQPLEQPSIVNQVWSMDFMSDSMVNNRKVRIFNVIDDSTREVLAIEVDTSISSKRLIRTLDRVIESEGKPMTIRVDNGPEFTSSTFALWAKEHGIIIQYIQPGKPMQNGFIERFNRILTVLAGLQGKYYNNTSAWKQLPVELKPYYHNSKRSVTERRHNIN